MADHGDGVRQLFHRMPERDVSSLIRLARCGSAQGPVENLGGTVRLASLISAAAGLGGQGPTPQLRRK